MRTVILLTSVIFAFASCSKDADTITPNSTNEFSEKYSNTNGTSATVNSKWYVTKEANGGGNVWLKISGATNGQRISVETMGDGVKSDDNVELDATSNFNKDIVICFFATSLPKGEFEKSTTVNVYRGSDVLAITLKSGMLKY